MDTKIPMPEEIFYDIVAGANGDALLDICRRTCENDAKLPTNLNVTISYAESNNSPSHAEIKVTISSIKIAKIKHENDSGESFNLQGYCKADLDSSANVACELYGFEAYYNSKTRKGRIAFIEQSIPTARA